MKEKNLNLKVINSTLREDAALFEPIRRTGKSFYITLSILLAIILWAAWAYLHQYRGCATMQGAG